MKTCSFEKLKPYLFAKYLRKRIQALLTYVITAKSNLILHYTEANGCIYFLAGCIYLFENCFTERPRVKHKNGIRYNYSSAQILTFVCLCIKQNEYFLLFLTTNCQILCKTRPNRNLNLSNKLQRFPWLTRNYKSHCMVNHILEIKLFSNILERLAKIVAWVNWNL